MAKGILYVMSTIVPGLIKIGKTNSDGFENRMYSLEHNGYANVTGLKRKFAIEVDEYDEKESMMDEIFSKARVFNTELFALDIDLAVQLLSSFDGRQVYPKTETKKESFDEATAKRRVKENWSLVPNGTYYLSRKIRRNQNEIIKAMMIVKNGEYIIPAGSHISPTETNNLANSIRTVRHSDAVKDFITQEDISFMSPSAASDFIIGGSTNGWNEWKNENGNQISVYREE